MASKSSPASESGSEASTDTCTPSELEELAKDPCERERTRHALARPDPGHQQRSLEQSIANSWSCGLEDILPTIISPRVRVENGKRVGHDGRDRARLPVRRWIKVLKSGLVKLSALTWGDMGGAHEKLIQQVKQRQKERRQPEHYARELLHSDIKAVIRHFRSATEAGIYQNNKPSRVKKLPSAKDSTEGAAFDAGDGNIAKEPLHPRNKERPPIVPRRLAMKHQKNADADDKAMMDFIMGRLDGEDKS